MTHERTAAENRNMTGVQIRSGIRAITENIAKENGVTSDYLLSMLDELNRRTQKQRKTTATFHNPERKEHGT